MGAHMYLRIGENLRRPTGVRPRGPCCGTAGHGEMGVTRHSRPLMAQVWSPGTVRARLGSTSSKSAKLKRGTVSSTTRIHVGSGHMDRISWELA